MLGSRAVTRPHFFAGTGMPLLFPSNNAHDKTTTPVSRPIPVTLPRTTTAPMLLRCLRPAALT